MNAILNIAVKVWVKQFYIVNAGFFMFAFFFFFGIVNAGQLISYHRSLIEGMIVSPVFMLIVMMGWLWYIFKCSSFCNNVIISADSTYLYALKTLAPAKQWLTYSVVSALMYLPVLVYSIFVIQIAISKSILIMAVLIAGYQLLMIILSAGILFNNINSNRQSFLQNVMVKITNLFTIQIGYNFFLTNYLLHSKKKALLVIKIFSLLLLSVSFVRNGDNFDADLFGIFFQVIMAAHAALVFYCVDFNEQWMSNNRNLPIAWWRIAAMYLLTWTIVLLPEMAFMFINNQGNLPLSTIALQWLTSINILLLYTGIVYACSLNMERYMLFVLVAFIMLFFFQKTGLQLIMFISTGALALAVFKAHYFAFEKE